MDLAIAIVCCNCTIAIVIFALTVLTIRIRRQLIGLTNFCDRSLDAWNLYLNNPPASTARIVTSRRQFEQLKQLYQRQLITLDRIRAIRNTLKIARSILRR